MSGTAIEGIIDADPLAACVRGIANSARGRGVPSSFCVSAPISTLSREAASAGPKIPAGHLHRMQGLLR